jgi:hypothetical protein
LEGNELKSLSNKIFEDCVLVFSPKAKAKDSRTMDLTRVAAFHWLTPILFLARLPRGVHFSQTNGCEPLSQHCLLAFRQYVFASKSKKECFIIASGVSVLVM